MKLPNIVGEKAYAHQLKQRQETCENAYDWDRQANIKLKSEQKASRLRITDLEKELNRKEKALAEVAALLVLQKKVQAIWENPEEK